MRHSGEKDSETLFPELMSQLSPENLDQVKALGIATEAFKGGHIYLFPHPAIMHDSVIYYCRAFTSYL